MAILNLAAGPIPDSQKTNFYRDPERTVLEGPLTMFRLAGTSVWIDPKPGGADPGRSYKVTARTPERGAWWFDRTMLDALSDDVLEANYEGTRWTHGNVLAGTRTDLAVKERWSNMMWFCIMRLLPGQALQAWVGPAEQQQDRGTGFFEGMMPGGGRQYFIPGLADLPGVMIERMPTHTALNRLAASPSWRG